MLRGHHWKLIVFDWVEQELALQAVWANNARSFGPTRHVLLADGGFFTNLSERNLRRLANSGGVTLPRDWLHLPDDDEQLREALDTHRLDLAGRRTKGGAA